MITSPAEMEGPTRVGYAGSADGGRGETQPADPLLFHNNEDTGTDREEVLGLHAAVIASRKGGRDSRFSRPGLSG